MSYSGSNEATAHRQAPLDALVLVNLGTPAAPTAAAVRRYLSAFLSDPRVIELPRWLWLPVLHGVILRLRPKRSARAYARVWTAAGSPLLTGSEALTSGVRQALAAAGSRLEVHLAMSYGEPSLAAVLEGLRQRGLRRLLVLPLYPQYSGTTTASVFDALGAQLRRWRWIPELRFVSDYHQDPGYVAALVASVRAHWAVHGRAERLLLSFHGIPRRYLLAGDPYFCQCQATARLLRKELALSEQDLVVSFQSRVGREVWLQPYTDQLLAQWARSGIRRVQVMCPGFAIDCLETLDEIAHEAAENFVQAGGEALEYIPALNARAEHVQALLGLLARHAPDWGREAIPSVPETLARADAVRAGADWLRGADA